MGRVADFFSSQNITLAQTQKRQMLALDQEFSKMEAKIQVLEAENLKLQAQVNPLEREVKRHKEQIKEDALTFDSHTGTHVDSSGLRHCAKCFAEQKRIPLKIEQRGWRCMVCGKWYPNPGAQQFRVITDDPDDWMGR